MGGGALPLVPPRQIILGGLLLLLLLGGETEAVKEKIKIKSEVEGA